MFMKRKIKSAKGFTLAELLIVVAIIAVLVAIGIPIFTSQLEKSREAVDLSDVRSAYAEVMMAAITGDTTAYYTKDANQTIYKQPGSTPEGNVYSITVEPLKQKQDNWQTALPITIGGVSSTDNVHWVGNPGANGKCRIVYTPAQGATGDYVTFYWEGGSSGNDGTDVNPTPNPSNPTITPDPTNPSNPGDGGGDSTGENKEIEPIVKKYGSSSWPDDTVNSSEDVWIRGTVRLGEIVCWDGKYYVCAGEQNSIVFVKTQNTYNYWTPENEAMKRNFIPIKNNVHTEVVNGDVTNLSFGDLFKDPDSGDVYIYNVDDSANCPTQGRPTGSSDAHWIKITDSSPNWVYSNTYKGLFL